MSIRIGDRLPAATLWEFVEEERPGCSVGPNEFKIGDLVRSKRIAILGLPGAFTPTCSAKHLPGFVQLADRMKSRNIDEIWCVSVNDAFVMNAWGREQGVKGKVRMMADGSGQFTKAMGLELDLNSRGMGMRSRRYSMLVDDGKVTLLNVEEPGKFEVSDAETLFRQLENTA